nr:DeoR/GlpR family DNA-binding transcription regulator [uncultured Dyadobacter sp.]
MIKQGRFEHILSRLKASQHVHFEELAIELNVSEDTIRRDIDILEKNGLLVKVRRGAIIPAINPLSFHERAGLFPEGKQRIALKAQQQLSGAKTVFMDGGTTILAIAAAIPIKAELRIITNNIALPAILQEHERIEIISLGGNYNRNTQTTIGVQTCLEARKYIADLYLMGTCGISHAMGVTAQVAEDGEVKRAFLESARKSIALVTQEKLGRVDFFKVADLDAIDTIVTDLPSDDFRLNDYRFAGREII